MRMTLRMAMYAALGIAGLCAMSFAGGEEIHSSLRGKCGATLKEAVRHAERPHTLIAADKQAETFGKIDADDTGQIINRYSGVPLSSSQPIATDHALPPVWWDATTPDYGDTAMLDLHTLFPCPDAVPALKADYPPGETLTPTYDNGVWQVGYGQLAGERIWVYTPAVRHRGDVARAVFHAVTLYPADMWNGLGVNLLEDNTYPTLNAYARRVLLKWHTDDPVDEQEAERNDKIARLQGNHNLFVSYPELVDHIWGENSKTPWDPTPTTSPETSAKPLKAVYTPEETIFLYSPYIPENASWAIDGKPIAGNTTEASALGQGIHELRFTSENTRGKIKITIR